MVSCIFMCFIGKKKNPNKIKQNKKPNLDLDLESHGSDFTPCRSCDHQQFDVEGHTIDSGLLLLLGVRFISIYAIQQDLYLLFP